MAMYVSLIPLPIKAFEYQGHHQAIRARCRGRENGHEDVDILDDGARTKWWCARRRPNTRHDAFALKIGQWGGQAHTMRAFRREEMEAFSRKSNNRREASATAAAREWSRRSRAT